MPVDTKLDPHHALPPAPRGEATISDPAHLLPEQGTTTRPRGGRLRLGIVLLIILLAVGLIVWRIHTNNATTETENRRSAAAANRAIPVQVAAVQQQTVPVYLTALGTVTAYNTVTLRSRVDGQLLQVNFHEGQPVRKGQLLLQIDPRPYQATLDQALGTLARDEANLHNAEAEAQRYTALYEAGVVSKEQQQTQASNAGQASGSIKADQAAIEAAKVNLGYTRIYAPIDGVVGLRQVDPGNIVHAGDSTGLVVITQVHPIAIIFTVPEDQLPQVQQAMRGGRKLVVEAYDRTDAHKIAAGTLLTIDNQIDTTTGTAKLKAVFDNADGSLFPNQFVNIRLILRQRENATVVPTAAIQSGNQGDYVFVVNPGLTPADKLPNQSGSSGGQGQGGGHRRHDAQGASGQANAGNGSEAGGSAGPNNGSNAAAGGPTSAGHGRGGQSGPPPCPAGPNHVDAVPVHVDFALDTRTVIADGALHAGQQVVVDGAEKLVDRGNVCPQPGQGHSDRSDQNGPRGSGLAAHNTGHQPGGVDKGDPKAAGQNGQQSNSRTTGGNGGGRP